MVSSLNGYEEQMLRPVQSQGFFTFYEYVMRRYSYIKYLVTLLMSTALTFRVLQSRGMAFSKPRDSQMPNHPDASYSDIPEDDSSNSIDPPLQLFPQDIAAENKYAVPEWTVLPGNVTVHIGEQSIPEDTSSFVINPTTLCDSFDLSRLSLLIFIESSAGNFAERQGIRDTWGLQALQYALNFRVVFLLGEAGEEAQKHVAEEGFRYGDVVQLNITDTFRNLGRKSSLGLRWATTFCSRAEFIMKTDDDILIHVLNLLQVLRRSKDPETLLLCHENRMRRILRKELLETVPTTYRKYEVADSDLPGIFYPPYCSGMAYVFSQAVGQRLLYATLVTPVFFIEDVYVTGFCRHKAGINITPHPGITLRPPVSGSQAACAFKDGRITSQEVSVKELRQLWAEVNTQGFFCPRLLGYAQTGHVTFPERSSKMKKWRNRISAKYVDR